MSGRYGKVCTCGLRGVAGELMEVEVALLPGLPSFEIVGMGDSVVRESRNRIRAAVRVSGFDFPHGRIIASLAPAWVRKEGSAFDLRSPLRCWRQGVWYAGRNGMCVSLANSRLPEKCGRFPAVSAVRWRDGDMGSK
jgi:hypothetical protein